LRWCVCSSYGSVPCSLAVLLAVLLGVGVEAAADVRRLVELLLLCSTGMCADFFLVLLLLLGLGHAEEVVEGESSDDVEDDIDPEDTVE
jgi:hypothetical protein